VSRAAHAVRRVHKLRLEGGEVASWGGFGAATGQFKAPLHLAALGDEICVAESETGLEPAPTCLLAPAPC
jgi:hypothetical protein